eukprot:gene24012-9585_t
MAEGVNTEINVDQLKMLKQIFDEADDDGSGELDIDEFCEKLGPHLGGNLTRQQISQLFLKIDADAGGTVDWEEFTNYMFLEKAQEAAGVTSENWRLFPQDFRDKNDPGVFHRGPVDKVLYCEPIDKYITCSRDGTFRLWNGADLKHFRTMSMGTSWITDCIFMPSAHKLVFTTVDRAISYYETQRGSFELIGRVYASGGMGVPQTLTLVTNDVGEQIVYGDSKGHLVMLLCGTKEWPARDLISTEEHQDYLYIHQEHTDWVSKVEWVPEVGLVSSSIDSSIRIYDFVREKVVNSCNHHQKAVHSFVWCSAYSMFASCGLERDIILWQGNTTRRIGELTGHTASITHISIDDKLNHVFSLSVDKVIKVWDLRNHRCLQTIQQDDWRKPEESKPHCLVRVLTAVNKPYAWCHKLVAQDRTGHMDAVRGALYNAVFDVIVSADESGTVCVWNIANGTREGRFQKAHGDAKNQRRLVTASGEGEVVIWNFNNGSKLREYEHDEEKMEISTVFVWEDLDDDNDVVEEYRTYEGHREDITHMTAYTDRQLLATGDYEGRITIWNLFTGEKRMSLFHRAERYETGIEKLLWIPIKSHMQRAAQAAARGSMSSAGGSESGSTKASSLGSEPRRNVRGGRVEAREVARAAAKASEDAGCSGNGGMVSATNPMILLSSGGDGLLRVWLIGSMGKLMCTLQGAQGKLEQVPAMCCDEDYNMVFGKLEQVSAMCCDEDYNIVVIGDTAGHIRIFDISEGISVSSTEACRTSFKQTAHWRAHKQGINSVNVAPERNLLIVGSKDTNVTIWTMEGGLLGTLGDDVWELDDLRTWKDPDGEERMPPMGEADNLYLQVLAAEAEAAAAAADKGEGEPDPLGEFGCVQLASMMLADKKAKNKEVGTTKPSGLHSMLKVHDLHNVPSNVRDLLGKSDAGKAGTTIATTKRLGAKAARAAAAAADKATMEQAKMEAAHLGRGTKRTN